MVSMTSHLPPTSFFATRAARVDLARRRFFDEGVVPTGMVSDAVLQSWSRCLRLHHRPGEQAVFAPVTTSRTHLALQKNRHLLDAWIDVSTQLKAVLGATSCAAMLTDTTGVLIGSLCAGRAHEELMPVATRIGVNLSEEAVGTTAPGVVTRTGKAVCVLGADHFFTSVRSMYCAATPIRSINGTLAGVLDLSSESFPFAFDAAAVTSLYAKAIENRLLVAQSTNHLVIRIQVAEELLNSALVGLVGVDSTGRLAWQNDVASNLLGMSGPESPNQYDTESSFGMTLAQLVSLPSVGAITLTLPNGLLVWARAQMRSPDGRRNLVAGVSPPSPPPTSGRVACQAAPSIRSDQADGEHGPATPTTASIATSSPARSTIAVATLRESDRALIERTLRSCGGNVSEAAKSLGVSRNLIYRRLRTQGTRGSS